MPSLRTFRLEFDRAGSTYGPGDIVSGRVIIDLSEPKNVRALKLSVKGESNVRWSVHRTERDSHGRTHHRTDYVTGHEQYFDLLYSLLTPAAGESTVQLCAGHSEYAFDFQLPQRIPCSFEHTYGHIRYTVKAVIDRPWRFNHECKTAFTVVTPYDLNLNPGECIGVDDETYDKFCCFCCFNVGSMNVRIKVPTTGYAPGQTIQTQVYLDNQSKDVNVTKVCTKLEQTIKFHASQPHSGVKVDNNILKKDKKKGPFNKRDEIVSRLQIPPLPPSHLEFCTIIELDYKLKVTVHVSGIHCSIVKSYPIVIGTIPLRMTPTAPSTSLFPDPIARPTAPTMDGDPRNITPTSMPMPTSSTSSSLPSYARVGYQEIGFVIPDESSSKPINWDMPPPSYEECISRTESIRDHNESTYVRGVNEPFAPRYPVFTFPPPYSGS